MKTVKNERQVTGYATEKKGSIKSKLILSMVILTALPLIIAIVISFVQTISKAKVNYETINQQQTAVLESRVSELINENIRAMESVAHSPQVIAFMKGDESQRDAIVSYLQSVDATMADNNSTVLTGPDGMQLARSKGDCVDVSTRDYFGEAMAGHTYISNVVVSKTTGSRIVVPVVPVYDTDGRTVIGFIQRNFSISILHDFVVQAAEEGQTLVITDRNGVVIAHSLHEITAEDEDDDRSATDYFKGAKSNGQGTVEEDINGKTMILSYQLEPTTEWVVVVERDYDQAMAEAVKESAVIVVIGVILIVVAVIVSVTLAQGIAKPVQALDETFKGMAEGEFKRLKLYADRNDEFGAMVESTNSVIDRLNAIVGDIKESANSVNASAIELASTAGQISDTADGVANAVQEIATGATQQADEVQSATENTARISENILNVTNSAENVKSTADEMKKNSQESAELMRKLRTITQDMVTSIDSISEKIGATSDAVERISGKVAAINSIASQTNLLALNASIEAARAGEAGRGFAVVAEEIGKLADDSSHTADEIRQEMSTLLDESQSAVKQADKVRIATGDQMDALTAAINSIRELVKEIESTVDGVDDIAVAAEACDASKTVVVDAMSSLSAISEENAAASEETSASMEELSATVTTLASTADSLRSISEKLIEEMQFFK